MTKETAPDSPQYDPYKKEKEQQFSIIDLLNNQELINARIEEREPVGIAKEPEEEETEEVDVESMTVAELKAALEEVGIDYPASALKADLVQLYSDYLTDAQ